jgi:hypothetical protein
MWMRLLSVFALAITFAGCKDLKEQQLGAYVGDSQTKVVYKNVGKNTEIVPKDRRVMFRSQEEAMDQGYTPENMAGDEQKSDEENP